MKRGSATLHRKEKESGLHILSEDYILTPQIPYPTKKIVFLPSWDMAMFKILFSPPLCPNFSPACIFIGMLKGQ
jgi:hypothetical protein